MLDESATVEVRSAMPKQRTGRRSRTGRCWACPGWAKPDKLGYSSPHSNRWGTFGSDMDIPMAYTAKRYEIFFHIVSQTTPLLDVMDLEIFRTSASLASPAIAFEYLLPEVPIIIVVQAKLRIT